MNATNIYTHSLQDGYVYSNLKQLVRKLTHFKCNFLILSKTSFFDVDGPALFFFKGVSSLSELCSAGNVDALLYDVAGSGDISLTF